MVSTYANDFLFTHTVAQIEHISASATLKQRCKILYSLAHTGDHLAEIIYIAGILFE